MTDEKVLRDIIKTNVNCVENKKKIRMNIYYKNLKTYNTIIKNITNSLPEQLDRTNLIYGFTCPLRHNNYFLIKKQLYCRF